MTFDRADSKRGMQVFKSMPRWLILKLNEERSVAGLDPLPVEGRANDYSGFSPRQRSLNKQAVARREAETPQQRIKRLGAAKRRMKNS